MGIEDVFKALVKQAVRDELATLATSPADEYLTTDAAAKIANVIPGTIRRWVKNGKLREQRAGRVIRVSRADLTRMMNSGRARNDSSNPEAIARRKHG